MGMMSFITVSPSQPLELITTSLEATSMQKDPFKENGLQSKEWGKNEVI